MEITFNYVDRSLNLRGVLSTKNMNYRGNIQKLINDDSYIKKWRNFLNFVFYRLKKSKQNYQIYSGNIFKLPQGPST